MVNPGLRAIVGALLLASGAGCYTHHPAARDRGTPEPIPASTWDLEITDALRELEAMTPATVHRYAIDESVPERERSPDASELAGRVDKRVTHAEIRAGGLLRLYEDAEPSESFDERFGFRPNGSYITSRRLVRERVESPLDGNRYRDRWLLKEHPGLRLAEPTMTDLLLDEQGVVLGVPASTPDARGIVLHLPALFGTPYETRVLEHLERRGWAIAHVKTKSWIAGPNHLEREQVEVTRQERRTELVNAMLADPSVDDPYALDRVNAIWEEAIRQAEAEFPMPETGFELREGVDPDVVAGRIAESVDHHLVEHANAAAALVGYLDEHRPDLSGRPVVVVAFSAGALAAPTVAARLGDRVSAVVMIGGGASVFDVSRTSTFGHGGINVAPPSGPPPPEHLVDEVGEQYRLRTRVDPYRAARALRSTPVLHVYGRSDEVIPTSAAETLREQLGEPDRLVFSGGHGGLFYFLPGQRAFLGKWIDDAVGDTSIERE